MTSKKTYIAPALHTLAIQPEGLCAGSDPDIHDEYSKSDQLSKRNDGWNSELWSSMED